MICKLDFYTLSTSHSIVNVKKILTFMYTMMEYLFEFFLGFVMIHGLNLTFLNKSFKKNKLIFKLQS